MFAVRTPVKTQFEICLVYSEHLYLHFLGTIVTDTWNCCLFSRTYLLPICDNISSQGIDVTLKLGYFLHATVSFIRYKILNYHLDIFVKKSLQYLCKDSMSFIILEVVNTSIAEITENYSQNIHNQKANSLPLMPKNIEVNVLDSSICIFISHH